MVASLLSRGVALSATGALLDDRLLAAAEGEARGMHSSGMMHSSSVKDVRSGGQVNRYTDPTARGDVIRWLDGSDARYPACSALAQWLRGELMDAVREALDAAPDGSVTGSGDAPRLVLESHNSLPLTMLACYPGSGARFKLHVDNTPEAPDTRAVTAVLYLNGEWQPSDGGVLRVYGDLGTATTGARLPSGTAAKALEVEPRRGTLALFWSHRVPHEVMPAATARFALSLWMCVGSQQPPGWLDGRSALVRGLSEK